MKNIIKIEDTEYIKVSIYNELKEKKKQKVKEVIKQEIELNDYLISDPTCCGGILPCLQRENPRNEIEDIETSIGYFKKYEIKKLTYSTDGFDKEEILEINGSKYSKKFIDGFRQMAKVWFSDVPEIFMRYDKKKEKWLKGNPILFLFGINLTFVLAPRVDEGCIGETEEED